MAKTQKQKKGMEGEKQALSYFRSKSYKILRKNYRNGRGEVDLVLQKGEFMVFCEVKTRQNSDYGFPESFVGSKQKQQIRRASEALVERYHWEKHIRFDILSIIMKGEVVEEVFHIKDAF